MQSVGVIEHHGGRKRHQGDHHDKSHHAHYADDGEGDEGKQKQIEEIRGQSPQCGVFLVEADDAERLVEKRGDENDDRVKNNDVQDVVGRNEQYVSEEVAHQIALVAGRERGQKNAQGHADGPERRNDGLLVALDSSADDAQDKGGQLSTDEDAPDGSDVKEKRDADAAQDGVGDAAGDEGQSSYDHQASHDAAGYGNEKAGQKGFQKEGIDLHYSSSPWQWWQWFTRWTCPP